MRAITLLFFLFLFQIPVGHAQVEETIEPEYIRTIQFKGASAQSRLPIIELGQKLQLSFDDIIGNEADYFYTIAHFNFDWTPSDLSKGEYLDGFDDVRIETYENSFNTLQLYSNYKLSIPNRETRAIKKSGNYLLRIFNDDGEIVFSRKFMVLERVLSVEVEIKRSRIIKNIDQQQVVQFKINSPNLLLINPKQNVKTLVLQNNNLKTAITNLKPLYTIGSELIYKYDQEAAFWGGNEFLFFDNKDLRSSTNGVRYVELNELYENFLFTNIDRSVRPYTYNPDINGSFQVRNLYASQNQNIEADYVLMHFNLQHYGSLGDKEIHIYGNFNNWTIDQTTYMRYNEKTDTYQNARLFKQGFYNYKYVMVNRDGSIEQGPISGNFWETENQYTVLVYYRAPGSRFDRLLGKGSANSSKISNN
ncbi:MAG: type IX secretion system plug protein [Flavobacteriales bacterium]